MVLTNEKIAVTQGMMDAANMTRWMRYGVPVDPMDKSKGLVWKNVLEMEDEDWNKIEDYFLSRAAKQS